MALVLGLFSNGPARNRALSVYAATATLGITAGMLVGGMLVELANWRWVMFVNAPIALAALLSAVVVIPDVRPAQPRPRLDVAGAIIVTGGLVALLYALNQAVLVGWNDHYVLVALLISIVMLVSFVETERRLSAPLIPAALLRDRTIMTASMVMLLKSTIGIAVLFLPTLYFQQVRDYSPLISGLAFVPAGLASLAASLTGPRLVRRLGNPRAVIVLALALQSTGLMLMTVLPVDGPWPALLLGTVLVLVGFLWSDVALNFTLSVTVSEETRGAGTGMLRTAAQVGGAIGLGVLATIVTARRNASDLPASPEALIAGLQTGLWCGAAFAVIGLTIAVLGLRPTPPPH